MAGRKNLLLKKGRAFLFDFDGVIADSEPLHLQTFRETLAPLGITISKKRWHAEFTGRGSPYIMKTLLGEIGIKDEKIVKRYVDERRELFGRRVAGGNLRKIKGIGKFLSKCRKEGVALAVVSGGHKSNVLLALSKLGLGRYFRLVLGREDYKNTKPDPEPYVLACREIGVGPKDCVVFEDSVPGCISARAAGVGTVVLVSATPIPRAGLGRCPRIKDFEGLCPGELGAGKIAGRCRGRTCGR